MSRHTSAGSTVSESAESGRIGRSYRTTAHRHYALFERANVLKLTKAEKASLIKAAVVSMPAREWQWLDLLNLLHARHGPSGFSSSTVYSIVKANRFADLPIGGPCRTRIETLTPEAR